MALKSRRLPSKYGEDNSDGSISLSEAYKYEKGRNDGKMDDMKTVLEATRKKPTPELLKEIDAASEYVRKSPVKAAPVAEVDASPEPAGEEMPLESALAMGLPPIPAKGQAKKGGKGGKQKLI